MSKPTNAPKPQPAAASAPAQPTTPAPTEPTQATPVEAVTYHSPHASMRYPAAPNGSIKFADGEYTTSDPAEIAYLDERATCERA